MKVKLSDIIDAIEMTDQYSEYFLDKETGKVEWVSDMAMTQKEQEEVYDRLDEHGFYRLPTSFDIHDYDIMEESGVPGFLAKSDPNGRNASCTDGRPAAILT